MGDSRKDLYLDIEVAIQYVSTVRCQRDIMSSMKAETHVIRSTVQNLLLQYMESLLLQLLLVEPIRDFTELYQSISIIMIRKYVFGLILFKNTYAYDFMWIAIHWVCRIDTYCSQCLKLIQKSCRSSCPEFQTINIKLKKNQQKVPDPPKLSASDWRTSGNFQH